MYEKPKNSDTAINQFLWTLTIGTVLFLLAVVLAVSIGALIATRTATPTPAASLEAIMDYCLAAAQEGIYVNAAKLDRCLADYYFTVRR